MALNDLWKCACGHPRYMHQGEDEHNEPVKDGPCGLCECVKFSPVKIQAKL